MSKINIYVDARCLVRDRPSGVGRYMASILKAIDGELDELYSPKNVQYHLIVPFRRAARINDYQFRNFKIKKIYLPLRGMNLLSRKHLLPPLDLLFGRGIYVFPEFIRLPVLFSKSVSILYDAAYAVLPESVDKKMRKYLAENIGTTVHKSTRLITISNSAQHDLAKAAGIMRSAFKVIRPSIQKTIFYPRSSAEMNRVRARYELFDNYILAVGNYEPRKNLINLFHAYASLPKEITDEYTLLVVGASSWNADEIYEAQGRYKEQGLRIITRLGCVPDQDLAAVYSAADLFVYPSIYEGFGMPVLEAMACGVPVICGKNSSLPEAAGSAAEVVDEKSPMSISRAMVSILSSKSKQASMRKAGFAHVDACPPWKDAAADFQDILIQSQSKSVEKFS